MKIGSIKHKDVEATDIEGEPREIVNFVRQLASTEGPEEARRIAQETSGPVRGGRHGKHMKSDVLMSYIRDWAKEKPGFDVYDLAKELGKEPYSFSGHIRELIHASMPDLELRGNLVYPKGSSKQEEAAALSPSVSSLNESKTEPIQIPAPAIHDSAIGSQVLVEPKPYYERVTFQKKEVQLAGVTFTVWKEGVVWRVMDPQGRTRDVGRDYDITSDLDYLKSNLVSQKELAESSKLRPVLFSVLIGLATGKFNKNYLLDDALARPKDRQINLDAPIHPSKLLQFLRGEGMKIEGSSGNGVGVVNPKTGAQAWVKMGRGNIESHQVRSILNRLGVEYE